MPDLPKLVKIGGQSWRLRKRLRDDGTEGFTYGRTTVRFSLIEINRRASIGNRRDTVTHEVLHALLSCFPHGMEEEAEEKFVASLSPHLLALLRDNPQLIKFLTADD